MSIRSSLWLLFILTLILPNTSFAYVHTSEAKCSPIDFRNTFPMEIREQGDLSWCFAHAAADYLQYTYQLPVQISAADIAIRYSETGLSKLVNFFTKLFNKSERGTPPQTGFIHRAIMKTIPEGYCPESALPSDYWTQIDSSTGVKTKKQIYDAIMDVYQLQNTIQKSHSRSANDLPWYLDLKNINKEQFFSILANSSHRQLLLRIRALACGSDRRPYPHIPLANHFYYRGPHAFQRINAQFNRHLPTAVDFFSGIYDNYNHYKKRISDLHTVLLYGRKFDQSTHECTYLMKNSYGSSCKDYPLELKCEGGYLWLSESKLHDVLVSETFLHRR